MILGRICFCWLTLLTLAAAEGPERINGEIDGALYQIIRPQNPNGKLVLFAHGYRPETLPMSADYGAGNHMPATLLAEGWTLASSSYRRNGWIMEEAGQDLLNLFDHIKQEVMQPTEVYLIGNSMGGGVITWLAENHADVFDGGLCLGAYLFGPIHEGGTDVQALGPHYDLHPRMPLLYLTNTSELEGPQAYLKASGSDLVALWTVDRFGHVNQNGVEQLSAFKALVDWKQAGQIEQNKSATITLKPESTVTIEANRIEANAIQLVEVYGNFISNIVPDDFAALGIELGDTFELSANGQTVSVLMGRNYQDVDLGEWVAFWSAESYLLFCRNYKNAVETLGLELQNPLTVARVDD